MNWLEALCNELAISPSAFRRSNIALANLAESFKAAQTAFKQDLADLEEEGLTPSERRMLMAELNSLLKQTTKRSSGS